MRNRVERLRVWLVAGTAVLLLVIAAFLGYARYLAHHYKFTLPGKLGIDIVRETNGFTYSQSVQGKTVYTIHAARAVEHKDGKVTLHDVSVILYGRTADGASGVDRGDRISGSEFEYDQKASVIRALGVVHMDLQAQTSTSGSVKPIDPGAHMLHITTSGLIFLQNLGVASTNEPIEFQLGQMTGHATGADYDTDTGVVVLHAAVDLSGIDQGRPVLLNASHAILDRRNETADLTAPRYVSQGQTLRAGRATLYARADGSLDRVLADGSVTATGNGATLAAQHAEVALNPQGQPTSAVLTGGLTYADASPLRQLNGQARTSNLTFDASGRATHAEFAGAVHMQERLRSSIPQTTPQTQAWTTRDLTAATVAVDLTPFDGTTPGAAREIVRDVQATGAARLTGTTPALTGTGGTFDLSGDTLRAHLVPLATDPSLVRLDTMTATGHATLHQQNAKADQTSASDTLDAKFRAPASSSQPSHASAEGLDDLLSAVQSGHVRMARTVPPHPGAKPGTAAARIQTQHASADKAVYDGDQDRMTLTGSVTLAQEGSTLWANSVSLDRDTGDAVAQGSVRGSYDTPTGPQAHPRESSDPVHVLADHAELKRDQDLALFHGTRTRPARLWQAGSQIEAPELELMQEGAKLYAHGLPGATGPQVHSVLVGTPAAKPGTPPRAPSIVRVASGEMTYSDTAHQASFSGGVRTESAEGLIRSDDAVVTLHPAPAPAAPQAAPTSFGGSIERIVATGHIEIEQPGRRATGERLVYTAADALYVLTGTPTALPKVVDSARGVTSTGASLRFHTGDDAVEVSSPPTGTPAGRVRTETSGTP